MYSHRKVVRVMSVAIASVSAVGLVSACSESDEPSWEEVRKGFILNNIEIGYDLEASVYENEARLSKGDCTLSLIREDNGYIVTALNERTAEVFLSYKLPLTLEDYSKLQDIGC